jgi:2-polyprenyl-3-methyl-5-hydroxy-6-metoxy-1,4-benzoquinol methylase
VTSNLRTLARRLRYRGAESDFHSDDYVRHTQRRQEHLATLDLPIAGRSVLEVGAGIGDHTSFFTDRECTVVSTDGRRSNVERITNRFPNIETGVLDLDSPNGDLQGSWEIVYCYGTLYHLARPAEAIAFLAGHCTGLLLLETCVSVGKEIRVYPAIESRHQASQAISGHGCRPTRSWVFAELQRHFPNVYIPITQPWHEEFPLDWRDFSATNTLTRSVFVASRQPLENRLLGAEIPDQQLRA